MNQIKRIKSPEKKCNYPWLATYPDNINWDEKLTPTPVHELLESATSRYADRVCTHFLGKEQTYQEISHQTNLAAKGLQDLGVKKGDKVGLLLPNSPTYVIFYYAILKIGATVVNFNPLYTIEELEFQVKDSQTNIMVTLDLNMLFEKVEALLAEGVLSRSIICPFAELLPSLKSFLFRFFKGGDTTNIYDSPQFARMHLLNEVINNKGDYKSVSLNIYEDIALLQYTGGTTGTPKGAMLTHSNLSYNVQQIKAWAPDMVEGGEVMMGILPLFHVFAMTTVMNFGIGVGAELILVPKFELIDGLKTIHKMRPTIMPGVPTLYNALMNCPELNDYDLSSLKFCISGGAPLPVEIKRGFEKLSGCQLVEGYGLSETSPVATCNLAMGDVKEASIGIPLPQTIVSIRSLDNVEDEMPLGERGEICIKGPQVMKGYWNKPNETANVFVGEYLRTGDIGYMDDNGYIYIVDRLKDLILCSGFNVYPRQVEEAIYQFPGVDEVTVVGIPDDYRGEAPKAFIKMKEGYEENADDIFEFLEEKLSKIEMPEEIEFRKELPKTMVGKLSKKELREEKENSQ